VSLDILFQTDICAPKEKHVARCLFSDAYKDARLTCPFLHRGDAPLPRRSSSVHGAYARTDRYERTKPPSSREETNLRALVRYTLHSPLCHEAIIISALTASTLLRSRRRPWLLASRRFRGTLTATREISARDPGDRCALSQAALSVCIRTVCSGHALLHDAQRDAQPNRIQHFSSPSPFANLDARGAPESPSPVLFMILIAVRPGLTVAHCRCWRTEIL